MRAVDVVICGAGPVGLTMSMLLSREKISHVLLEKRPQVSELPRARGIMSRTVEIWSQFGLNPELTAFSLPPEWNHRFVYRHRLGGELIGTMPSRCMAPGAVDAFTPYPFRCVAQDKIDAMLWRRAAAFDDAELRFSTELLSIEQGPEHVVLSVRNPDGAVERLATKWLIAADGGKSPLREGAGIGCTGPTNLGTYLNTYFDADLSRWTAGEHKGPLIWALDRGFTGTFQALDGRTRWMCQIMIDPEQEPIASWTKEKVVRRLRDLVGDPAIEEVQFDLHSFYGYQLAACVADRLRDGRLFLIGDSAHRIPPAGGSGMNTGAQTAHNLAWKLAAVIRGEAGEGLLDSFDPERRQAAWRSCDYGRVNAHFIQDMVMAPTDDAKRDIIARSRQFGNWAGLDLGVHYEGDGAFVPDESLPPVVDDPVIDYVPTAKPGYRAPHLWLRRDDERISSIDLCDGRFVLLAGPEGTAWREAAQRLTAPDVAAYLVGAGGDWQPEGDFLSLYGLSSEGAVLVRPDGHVAFRSPGAVSDHAATLAAAMDRILARETSKERTDKVPMALAGRT